MAPRSSVAALVLALFALTSHASFIAIDYGSEWTKASLMSPGRKIDVLLNTDSKRKIQSVVAWNKADRLFGTDAFNIAARFPGDSFPSLKYLQGGLYGGSQSKYYNQITQAQVFENTDRGTCSIRRPDGTEWTVEELIGMQFAYIKDLAEKESKEKINEAVVTVPPFYTQFERQSVLDALEIAGLRPIALINDGMAVAINYATGRSFDNKETHIIYDAGASSITATVVSFYNSPIADATKVLKSSLKNATHVDVRSFGFDVVASGTELDRRLRDALVSLFEQKNGASAKGLKENGRAMARLWKEAQRVKAILSANSDSMIRVESLVGDIDFKDKITRQEFEKMSNDLRPRYAQPIADALEAAGLTMNDITSVILTGGASRIPMIRSAVKALVGDKIALNVNADEAAVLGAAFFGATTKTTWRTKPMRFQDLGGYDVQLKYLKEDSNKQLTSAILSPKSKTGVSHAKKLTFPKRSKDFTVTVGYKNANSIDFPQDIFEAKFSDITNALMNLTTEGVTHPQIRASFGITDSGMVFVDEAVATGEVKRQSIADKVKDFLNKDTTTTSATTEGGESSTAPASTPSAEADVATAPEIVTYPLKVEIVPLSIKPLTDEEKIRSQARLAAILDSERAKARREEALNHLEGYLYRLRDLLDAEDSDPFKQFVQPEEQAKLSQGLEEGFAWLHDEAHEADAVTLWKKRNDLESVERPVIARYKEAASGPKALNDLQKAHALARAFLKEANANRTVALEADLPPRFTDDDLKMVDETVTASENWLRDLTEKQKLLNKRQDPVLKTAEMEVKGITIQKLVKGLERKRPWRAPKPSSSSTTATTTATGTASGETTTAGGNTREEL